MQENYIINFDFNGIINNSDYFTNYNISDGGKPPNSDIALAGVAIAGAVSGVEKSQKSMNSINSIEISKLKNDLSSSNNRFIISEKNNLALISRIDVIKRENLFVKRLLNKTNIKYEDSLIRISELNINNTTLKNTVKQKIGNLNAAQIKINNYKLKIDQLTWALGKNKGYAFSKNLNADIGKKVIQDITTIPTNYVDDFINLPNSATQIIYNQHRTY